tara:strand:- start:437 stop:688 length:252 start_codon:yes stop_codon:yes gene_type:complete
MSNNYKEAFEKTRIAGSIAAAALNEVSKIAKPGVKTNEIDNLCYEFLNDHGAYSAPLFTGVFQNLVVRLLITLFVTGYHLKKF